MIEEIKLGFIILGLMAWTSLLFTFFYKRSDNNIDIPLIPQILLYIFSLVPLGLFVGLYMEIRQRKVKGVKKYKYSAKARKNATLMIAISLVSCILSAYNSTQN